MSNDNWHKFIELSSTKHGTRLPWANFEPIWWIEGKEMLEVWWQGWLPVACWWGTGIVAVDPASPRASLKTKILWLYFQNKLKSLNHRLCFPCQFHTNNTKKNILYLVVWSVGYGRQSQRITEHQKYVEFRVFLRILRIVWDGLYYITL